MQRLLLAALYMSFTNTANTQVGHLILPKGFKIVEYAKVEGARSLALGPEGTVFVSTMDDSVYALPDKNSDGKVDQVIELKDGLNSPNGIAIYKDDLYIAESGTVYVVKDIERNLKKPKLQKLSLDIKPYKWHGWRYIKFSPKGELYMGYGAPCNNCEKPEYAQIIKFTPPEWNKTTVAHGVRNTVGFDFHPKTSELWFTDNGRDLMGDDVPHDELNHLKKEGTHFGFPYCHQGDIVDPEYNSKKCSEFEAPVLKMGAHVATLGMTFIPEGMFPKDYTGQILVAEHGSWNRSKLAGYQVSLVRLASDGSGTKTPFVSGWLNEKEQTRSGRPVDVLFLKDGSLLISDDYAGLVYRVTH